MTRWMLVLASLYGFLGVAFGAFGAHALKEKVPPERLERLELAVRYVFFHVPALLATAWLASACGGELFVTIAGWAFGFGVLLFSGSLIVLALTGNRRWGAVTPFGGVLLLVGWIALAAAGWTIAETGDFSTALDSAC